MSVGFGLVTGEPQQQTSEGEGKPGRRDVPIFVISHYKCFFVITIDIDSLTPIPYLLTGRGKFWRDTFGVLRL